MIRQHEGQFAVRMMCRALSVSHGGYYAWRDRPPSTRAQREAQLLNDIERVFTAEKGRIGAPRVTRRLRGEGTVVGRNWVARGMRKRGLRARAARKFKATTNSRHALAVAPNWLEQNFVATAPNQKWVSDITYLWTDEGWLYLAVVLDLYARVVVGWSLSERMTTALVSDALTMALWRRKHPRGIIVHSDRGSQYCAQAYQQLLSTHGLICSMSKKGDCYDNAAMESWNHTLKVEAVHGERFVTRAQAKAHVFEYINVYYNRQRLHSSLGYQSPEAFEAQRVS